ncbi:hypothetical protein FRB99_002573 [Tulasnella sp. 403]|nr:hypothetical protein FRB99_002573 [Tulasnella sp. 403]
MAPRSRTEVNPYANMPFGRPWNPPKRVTEETNIRQGELAIFLTLPHELQEIVIGWIPRKQLVHLCCANRHLEMLARPVLYRDVSFHLRPQESFLASVCQINRLDAFAATLLNNPALGGLVRSLHWPQSTDKMWDVLRLLPNLVDLDISCMTSSRKIKIARIALARLRRVRVYGYFPIGGLSAILVRARDLRSLCINIEASETLPGSVTKDPTVVDRLLQECRERKSLGKVRELVLESIHEDAVSPTAPIPQIMMWLPMIEFLAPRIRTLKLSVLDRYKDANLIERYLVPSLTSGIWKHLHKLEIHNCVLKKDTRVAIQKAVRRLEVVSWDGPTVHRTQESIFQSDIVFEPLSVGNVS